MKDPFTADDLIHEWESLFREIFYTKSNDDAHHAIDCYGIGVNRYDSHGYSMLTRALTGFAGITQTQCLSLVEKIASHRDMIPNTTNIKGRCPLAYPVLCGITHEDTIREIHILCRYGHTIISAYPEWDDPCNFPRARRKYKCTIDRLLIMIAMVSVRKFPRLALPECAINRLPTEILKRMLRFMPKVELIERPIILTAAQLGYIKKLTASWGFAPT